MRVLSSCREVQAEMLQARRSGAEVSLVPTMGCLHEGHRALIREARTRGDTLVVSIFVNPLQFGPGEDYETYPRRQADDHELCRRESVDIVFEPTVDDLYTADHSTYVEESDLSAGMCGPPRPGHFRGVTTVVAKLFNIVQPDVAVFGRKDLQQARVIEKMVVDLNFFVRIVVVPTVYEADGLAVSSRNRYLSAAERRDARCLGRALQRAREMVAAGETAAAVVAAAVRTEIEAVASARVDYIAIVDERSLQPQETIAGDSAIAVAVFIGRTRLLDNARLTPA